MFFNLLYLLFDGVIPLNLICLFSFFHKSELILIVVKYK